jgi:nitrate reductase beta subunit
MQSQQYIYPQRYQIKSNQIKNIDFFSTNMVHTFIIYLSRVLCLSYSCLSSCHPVTIAERSAILLVLIIKLTQETRGRD